jgi:hypothetical protein
LVIQMDWLIEIHVQHIYMDLFNFILIFDCILIFWLYILYTRGCSTYDQFLIRGSLLTNNLMSPGFLQSRLQVAYGKSNGLYKWQILSDMFHTNRQPILDTLILTTVCTVYLNWNNGLRRVWPVGRDCLFLLGTWSYLWYIQNSVFALFSNLYFLQNWDWWLFAIWLYIELLTLYWSFDFILNILLQFQHQLLLS